MPFYPYHFVRIPFCPYTICPYHFVCYHFVRSPDRPQRQPNREAPVYMCLIKVILTIPEFKQTIAQRPFQMGCIIQCKDHRPQTSHEHLPSKLSFTNTHIHRTVSEMMSKK